MFQKKHIYKQYKDIVNMYDRVVTTVKTIGEETITFPITTG